jgi:peroxiredoxin
MKTKLKQMKIINLIIVLLTGLLFACNSKPDTFTIKGEFEGIDDSTKIELIQGATFKDEKPIAETNLVNGHFTFVDSLSEPRLFYIKIADGGGWMPVMLENSKITISGKPTFTSENGKRNYDYTGVKVSGSAIHELYLQKMAFHKAFDSIYKENARLSDVISKNLYTAQQGGKKEVYDSLLKTEEYKAMAERDKAFFEYVEKIIKENVLNNKDTWWGPFIMLNSMSYFTDAERVWYNKFPKEVQESYYGMIVKENLPRESWVGKIVPEFSGKKVDGSVVALKDLMAGKKYVLLDFWASWCGPCKKEIPNMKKLYAQYNSKGFEIISISIDKDPDAWKAAVKQFELNWPNLLDEVGKIADLYKVKLIPQMFLIDNTGKIILDGARGEELAAKMKELMK